MKNSRFFIQCMVILATTLMAAEWLLKTKQHVEINNIIDRFKELSVTSCHLKCKINKKCKSFGMERNMELGQVGECFLLAGNVAKYSGKQMGETMELYVKEHVGTCASTEIGCICGNGLAGKDCLVYVGSSCRSLKETFPSLRSGMYWINPPKPVMVYCDMETGKGGWMLIANINNTKTISKTEAIALTADKSMSNDINDLKNARNQKFRFNPVSLKDFATTFTQLRFYCHKPGGTTVHLCTSDDTLGKSVLDYFMLKTNMMPRACGSFKRYKDDNSVLGRSCERWNSGAWAGLSSTANRIYVIPFYIAGRHHFVLSGVRLECDDSSSSKAGVWKIFVR